MKAHFLRLYYFPIFICDLAANSFKNTPTLISPLLIMPIDHLHQLIKGVHQILPFIEIHQFNFFQVGKTLFLPNYLIL